MNERFPKAQHSFSEVFSAVADRLALSSKPVSQGALCAIVLGWRA